MFFKGLGLKSLLFIAGNFFYTEGSNSRLHSLPHTPEMPCCYRNISTYDLNFVRIALNSASASVVVHISFVALKAQL